MRWQRLLEADAFPGGAIDLSHGGDTLGRVLELRTGYGGAAFVLSVGGMEVCRYSWTIGGLTVLSAHLYVRLSTAAGVPFDRALALVMAPILSSARG